MYSKISLFGLLVLALSLAWLVYSTLQVKTDLESAKEQVRLVAAAETVDSAALADSLALATEQVSAAKSRVSDPIWTIASYIPLLGNAPHALREATFTVDELLAGTDKLQAKLRQTNTAEQFIDPELLALLSSTAVEFKPKVEAASARLKIGRAHV